MAFQEYRYNFPSNRRAEEGSRVDQLEKIEEESGEVFEAFYASNEIMQVAELFDLICAAENMLRKYDEELVCEEYKHCLNKGTQRGDW